MKVKIFLFTFNRPDLLLNQIKSIHKFLQNDYEISVVHDSRNDEFVNKFTSICEENRVRYVHHSSEDGNSPSYYHADCVQWAYDNLILKEQEDEIVVLLDHDMFLIDNLDIISYMDGYDIAGCLQERGDVKYLWPGMTIFKTEKIKNINFNFYPQQVRNQLLDTGGGTYAILESSSIKYQDTGVEYPEDYKGISLIDSEITNGYNYELHLDGVFLHYRNACNWNTGFEIKDQTKTKLLSKMLNDILDDRIKTYLEIVISRYNEDISWSDNISEYCTIYNKGEYLDVPNIPLDNIGREPHTYLHHIVNNYDNLSDYTMFLQGDPFNPHSPRLLSMLEYILKSNELLPDFFWVSERIVEGDFEYIREPYHKVFPNIKFAYKQIFGKEPDIESFIFGAGAQFVVSRKTIRSRSLEFYKNILDIFEHNPREELDEISVKLLGNSGIDKEFLPINPELSYHMERFWGIIFSAD